VTDRAAAARAAGRGRPDRGGAPTRRRPCAAAPPTRSAAPSGRGRPPAGGWSPTRARSRHTRTARARKSSPYLFAFGHTASQPASNRGSYRVSLWAMDHPALGPIKNRAHMAGLGHFFFFDNKRILLAAPSC